ncbi:ATP-binding protein [bacterium]|nr:ATP-binding protein [bacterium]MBP9810997.1 ATP-binding protein [bacterium]
MKAVITGGPSVGKTTIVNGLGQLGYRIVNEIATQIIKEGRILPWVDRQKFQAEVLKRQQSAEASILDFDQTVILDRGLFDGEAYYLHDKLPVPSAFSNLDSSQYDVAFLIEPLSFFEANEIRQNENLKFTKEISVILEHCYASRNVKVIRVPAMPAIERIEFVKGHVETLKKGKAATVEQAAHQAAYMFRGYAPVAMGSF